MRRALPFFVFLLLALAAPAGQAGLGHATPRGLAADLLPAVPDEAASPAGPQAALAIPGVTVAAGVGEFLVGYEDGKRDAALLAVQLAGGSVLREEPTLGVALVSTGNTTRFNALATVSPGVAYVERNDPTRSDGAQWNGAQWNGAQWNGAQWNGAQGNGVQWNARHGAPSGSNDPGRGAQWGIADVDAPKAWARTMGGRSANICVLDSGVAWDHRDLAANMWTGSDGSHGYNAMTGRTDAYDDAGHGTHIAGIAAAHVGNSYGVAGVGNVLIMAVKVLDAQGAGTEADLAFGLTWCARHGADVAVMALGVTEAGPTLDRALAFAASHDVLLVASAGNGGCADCVGYPASDPRVLAVAATERDQSLAGFSSRGPQVDLAAPGVDILSTFPGDRFASGSGTSQAVAFAAGAAALLRDAAPGLSAPQARDILTASARDLGPAGRDASFGHGLLNVDAALAQGARSGA